MSTLVNITCNTCRRLTWQNAKLSCLLNESAELRRGFVAKLWPKDGLRRVLGGQHARPFYAGSGAQS